MDIGSVTTSYMFTYIMICVVCAVSGISIIRRVSLDMGTMQERIAFRRFVTFFVVFALSNAVNVVCNTMHFSGVGLVFSALNLISIVACMYQWFYYIEVKLGSRIRDNKVLRGITMIPAVVLSVLIASTPFTHLIFYYENGVYTRGPLYPGIFLSLLAYMIYSTVHSFIKASSLDPEEERNRYALLTSFILYPLIGAIIDLFVPHVPIIELISVLGIMTVFTSLQQANVFVDALTDMNNRRKGEEYLRASIGRTDDGDPMLFFMADIDKFKRINDKYGHTEGDRAIKVVAAAFKDFGNSHVCQIARWGGDEFAVIGKRSNLGDPEKTVEELRVCLEKAVKDNGIPYELSISIGYSDSSSCGNDEEALIRAADKMMYRDKAA